jgi:bacterioferritin-associated ferredoxin
MTMYICNCNGLTQDFIEQKLKEGYTKEDLQSEFFMGLICGSCEDEFHEIESGLQLFQPG